MCATDRWPRCSRRRISNAAGPLTSAGTPAAYSPVSADHVAHTTAFPRMIQYVVAESPSSRSLRNVRTACGMVSRQESKAPVQARIVTITGVTSFARTGLLSAAAAIAHHDVRSIGRAESWCWRGGCVERM